MSTRRQQQRREKVERAARPPRWLVLPHSGLGMPLPALYVPRVSLPAGWPVLGQFVDSLDRDEKADMPVIRGAALDVRHPAEVALLAVELDGADKAAPLVVAEFAEVASGRLVEPSTAAWRQEAFAKRTVIVAVGAADVDRPYTVGQLLFTPGTLLGVVPLVAPDQPPA